MNFRALRIIMLLLAFGSFTACEKEKLNKTPIANAGAAQTIQLPTDFISLQGEGKDVDGEVISYLWSQVSGPGIAVIANPGSPLCTVSKLAEGQYIFQLMVVDDDGATGVDTVSVQVNPSLIKSLSLQPANNPNEVHIWGNNTNKEGSFNGSLELGAASWTHDGSVVGQRGLLKFQLSSIPANATILSAKLSIYSNPKPLNGDLVNANSGYDNSMLVQRVTTSWAPLSASWENQPATTSQDQIVVPNTIASFLDLNIDVTDLVQAMVQGNNYGFMIRLRTEMPYNSRLFCSSFYSDITKHPKLLIIYK